MQSGNKRSRQYMYTLFLGLVTAAFVVSVITYPEQAFQASLSGLRLWWDWVFPALLPFFIMTELLLGFGLVDGLGVFLEPLMRRVFRLPGSGGWVLATGIAGGYPLSADAAAKLSQQHGVSPAEAERLAALGHLANPMLIVGVVGAGFLHSPESGILLAIIHYLSAIIAGFCTRQRGKQALQASGVRLRRIPHKALRAMEEARLNDGRVFGKMLGDSVTQSVYALLLIGGLIMAFSVAVRLAGLFLGSSTIAQWFLQLAPGVLEPHLGAYAYSTITSWAPALRAAAIGAALAWSGLSVHAQAMGFMQPAGLRYLPFLRFRLLHSALAAGITLLVWQPLTGFIQGTEAVFSPINGWETASRLGEAFGLREMGAVWGASLILLGLVLGVMLLLSLVIRLLEQAASAGRRPR
jgi:sporulation integral membrane protein YlbJ